MVDGPGSLNFQQSLRYVDDLHKIDKARNSQFFSIDKLTDSEINMYLTDLQFDKTTAKQLKSRAVSHLQQSQPIKGLAKPALIKDFSQQDLEKEQVRVLNSVAALLEKIGNKEALDLAMKYLLNPGKKPPKGLMITVYLESNEDKPLVLFPPGHRSLKGLDDLDGIKNEVFEMLRNYNDHEFGRYDHDTAYEQIEQLKKNLDDIAIGMERYGRRCQGVEQFWQCYRKQADFDIFNEAKRVGVQGPKKKKRRFVKRQKPVTYLDTAPYPMRKFKSIQRDVYPIDYKTSLNPDSSLAEILTLVPGQDFRDTVEHKIMVPTERGESLGLKGKWHIKKPGKVSKAENIKRSAVNAYYKARGKGYKSVHYKNTRSVVEKEILAGKLTRQALVKGASFARYDWNLEGDMQFAYFNDKGEHSVGCQHIPHDHLATDEIRGRLVYDGEHNPATAYVFRRYLLGDEDGVKKGNYLVKVNHDAGVHCFIPIDYGLAFFNRSKKAEKMNFSEFVRWSLKLPLSHGVHYSLFKRGESIMSFINDMSEGDKTRAVYMALEKMAALTDKDLKGLCKQITDKTERNEILNQLKSRVSNARRLRNEAASNPHIAALFEPVDESIG